MECLWMDDARQVKIQPELKLNNCFSLSILLIEQTQQIGQDTWYFFDYNLNFRQHLSQILSAYFLSHLRAL